MCKGQAERFALAERSVEQLTVPDYAYYKTPLRPSSGNAISSTISVDTVNRAFTATVSGSSDDDPTDLADLTDSQASKGIHAS